MTGLFVQVTLALEFVLEQLNNIPLYIYIYNIIYIYMYILYSSIIIYNVIHTSLMIIL